MNNSLTYTYWNFSLILSIILFFSWSVVVVGWWLAPLSVVVAEVTVVVCACSFPSPSSPPGNFSSILSFSPFLLLPSCSSSSDCICTSIEAKSSKIYYHLCYCLIVFVCIYSVIVAFMLDKNIVSNHVHSLMIKSHANLAYFQNS